jgi:hypothetical protein
VIALALSAWPSMSVVTHSCPRTQAMLIRNLYGAVIGPLSATGVQCREVEAPDGAGDAQTEPSERAAAHTFAVVHETCALTVREGP